MRYAEKLILEKGGILSLNYKEEDENEVVVEKRELVSLATPFYLYEAEFEIQDGLTMGDVFLFLKKDLDYWELVLGNRVSEYVNQSFERSEQEDFYSKMDCLVLNWAMESSIISKVKKVNNPHLDFSGEGDGDVAGVKIRYGFGNLHTSNLNHLPVQIRKNLTVHSVDYDINFSRPKKSDDFLKDLNRKTFLQKYCYPLWQLIYRLERKVAERDYDLGEMEVSLFRFLYAIFYELSFYGGTEERKEFFVEMDRRCDEVKEQIKEKGIEALIEKDI